MARALGPGRRSMRLLVAGGVVLTILLVTASPPASPDPLRVASSAPAAPAPQLEVDPPTWWMPAGNSTALTAAWVDPVPGCGLAPLWFRWSFPRPTVEGTLNSTTNGTVTFVATSSETGTTTVRVRSAALLDCGGNRSAVLGMGEANITVVAPLALANLSIVPGAARVDGPATLEGTVVGGMPPYVLRVAWGDGTVSSTPVAAPGPFAIGHAFPAGTFRPQIVATDAAGLVADGSPNGALTASNSTAVGLVASSTAVDVGFPVSFTATVLDAPNDSGTGWSCGLEATAVRASDANATSFSCEFSDPGSAPVLFEVLPPIPDFSATATLIESVAPLPTLSAVSPALTAEVGQPCAVTFNVTGGVAPFRVEWHELGTPVDGVLSVASDGRVLLPLTPEIPGSLQLVAQLVDADGATTSNATTEFVVDPALNATAGSARTLTREGAELALAGSVRTGAPPFLWVVSPAPVPANGTVDTGTLASAGPFTWQGNYSLEGWATLTWIVVDAAGGFSSTTVVAEAVPPFAGTVTAAPGDPTAPGTFDLDVALAGGLPPFRLDVTASDGTTWNRTIASDGATNLTFTLGSGGSIGLEGNLTDALGAVVPWTDEVSVPAPAAPAAPPTPSPSPPPAGPSLLAAGLVGAVVLGGGVGALCLRRRRRGRSVVPAPPDPVAVLRRIIEPSDGADRGTVELLAEEAGIPLEDVRATIDRLIADRTLRSETDPDGEDVLSWSDPRAP